MWRQATSSQDDPLRGRFGEAHRALWERGPVPALGVEFGAADREEPGIAACWGAMARRAMRWALLLLTLALWGCDHATKLAATSVLGGRGPVAVVPGLLDLHYAENRDTAFSLLRSVPMSGKGALLVAASLVGLLVVVAVWWRRRGASTLEQLAYACLAAGALGNALDRLRRGFVVDFIEIHRWPIFTVADIAVVAGAVILAVVSLRRAHGERPPASPT